MNEEKAAPAQSDAPSAEPMSATRFYWDVYKESTLPDGRITRKEAIEFAEAYAALRTARLTENLSQMTNKLADYVKENTDLKFKVTQLERELENRQEAVNTYVRLLKQTLDEKDAAEDRAQQWVKVSERLPNPEHTVLWCKVPICEPPIIGSIEDGDFEYATDFTHWMAMPNEFWPGASGAAGNGGADGD